MPTNPLLFGRTTRGCGARYDGSLKQHGLMVVTWTTWFQLSAFRTTTVRTVGITTIVPTLNTPGIWLCWGLKGSMERAAAGLGAVANIRSADCSRDLSRVKSIPWLSSLAGISRRKGFASRCYCRDVCPNATVRQSCASVFTIERCSEHLLPRHPLPGLMD